MGAERRSDPGVSSEQHRVLLEQVVESEVEWFDRRYSRHHAFRAAYDHLRGHRHTEFVDESRVGKLSVVARATLHQHHVGAAAPQFRKCGCGCRAWLIQHHHLSRLSQLVHSVGWGRTAGHHQRRGADPPDGRPASGGRPRTPANPTLRPGAGWRSCRQRILLSEPRCSVAESGISRPLRCRKPPVSSRSWPLLPQIPPCRPARRARPKHRRWRCPRRCFRSCSPSPTVVVGAPVDEPSGRCRAGPPWVGCQAAIGAPVDPSARRFGRGTLCSHSPAPPPAFLPRVSTARLCTCGYCAKYPPRIHTTSSFGPHADRRMVHDVVSDRSPGWWWRIVSLVSRLKCLGGPAHSVCGEAAPMVLPSDPGRPARTTDSIIK